jgi:hypothetical protein
MVRIVDREIEDGVAGALQAEEELSLAELISRYLIHLGFESAFTSGIIVQLLTKGKVRVDFSKVAKRLELLRSDNRMTATQAMALYEEYVAGMRSKDEPPDKGKTVRIVVHKPRG